jgi:hypothetical protein
MSLKKSAKLLCCSLVLLGTSLYGYAKPSTVKTVILGEIHEREDDQKKGELLFNFERVSMKNGKEEKVTRFFKYPDGKVAVKESITYEDGSFVRSHYQQMQLDEEGWMEKKGDKVHFKYKKGSDVDRDTEDWPPNFVVSDQITPYLRERWSKITSDKTVKVRYPVYDRLETVGFEFERDKVFEFDSQPALRVKMSPSSFVISMLVDPIYLTYHREKRAPLLVNGRIPPKRKVNGKWQDVDALLTFTKLPQ